VANLIIFISKNGETKSLKITKKNNSQKQNKQTNSQKRKISFSIFWKTKKQKNNKHVDWVLLQNHKFGLIGEELGQELWQRWRARLLWRRSCSLQARC
jgi:hypothetical protein